MVHGKFKSRWILWLRLIKSWLIINYVLIVFYFFMLNWKNIDYGQLDRAGSLGKDIYFEVM